MNEDSPNSIRLAPGMAVPEGVLRFRYDRSSGPGGQNVNKLNTKATLTVCLDDLAEYVPPAVLSRLKRIAGHYLADDRLVISDESSRSQRTNRQACIDRLAELVLRATVRPKKRKPTRPSRGAVERRLKQKKRRGEVKRLRTRRPGPEA